MRNTWLMRMTVLPILVLAMLGGPGSANAQEGDALLASLQATEITARDLKALHYMQNAHGQLDEW